MERDERLKDLFSECAPVLLATAKRRLGNEQDANDIVQEVFALACLKIDQFENRGAGSGLAWLSQILAWRLVAFRRLPQLRKISTSGACENEVDQAEGPELQAERTELGQMVRALLAGLPELQRTAITLCDFEYYTQREAADLMGCTSSNVNQLRRKGLKRLEELLLANARCGASL